MNETVRLGKKVYPYWDIVSSVMASDTVEDARQRLADWYREPWTMDYFTDAMRARRARRDCEVILGVLVLLGCE